MSPRWPHGAAALLWAMSAVACTPTPKPLPDATASAAPATAAADDSPSATTTTEGTADTASVGRGDVERPGTSGLLFPNVERGPAPGDDAGDGTTTIAPPGETDPLATATAAPGGPCAGIVQRDGTRLVLDGRPVFLFGVNATMLSDPELKEDEVEPILADLAAREVNTVRVWYFHNADPDRFARLLDAGDRHGVRFVVTLVDNVFKGRDWFGGEEDEKRYRPHLARTLERFKDRPEVVMWELVNEPNCGERHDAECLDTIKGWLRSRAAEAKAIDGCHLISTGLIGAGNYDDDLTMYRRVHREPVIDIVSAHRRSTDKSEKERDVAAELDRPLLYGEVYDAAFTDGCDPQSDDALPRRAERIQDDLRDALHDGVAGYLLWDYAPGRLRRSGGKTKDYCNKFGFPPDDPLWDRLRADPAVPPAVPWQATVAP